MPHCPWFLLLFFPLSGFSAGIINQCWIGARPTAILSLHPDRFLIRKCCLYFCFRQQVVQTMSLWNTTKCLSFSMSCLITRHLVRDATSFFLLSFFRVTIYFLHSHTPIKCRNWIGTWLHASEFSLFSSTYFVCYVIVPYFYENSELR